VRKLGAEKVCEYAARIMDIPVQRLDEVPAIALGVSNLSPLEQAAGYTCFATGGLRAQRRLFTHITNYRGEVIVDNPPQLTRVLRAPTAIDMISMLRSVVTSGTGRRAQISGVAACGKTGTTQDGRDAWWVGFSPDLCAAVWVGNDDNKPMRGSSGGGFCAPVWQKFMKQAIETLGCNGKYPEGSGVVATKRGETSKEKEEEEDTEGVWRTICADTGMLATDFCPRTRQRLFAPGEQLPGRCNVHSGSARSGAGGEGHASGEERTVRVTICEDSGQLATPFCPRTHEMEFTAGSAPTGSCQLHGPPKEPAPSPRPPTNDTDEGTAPSAVPPPPKPSESPATGGPVTPPADASSERP
jgi:membrane peptidoglycan carboxypeptidase